MRGSSAWIAPATTSSRIRRPRAGPGSRFSEAITYPHEIRTLRAQRSRCQGRRPLVRRPPRPSQVARTPRRRPLYVLSSRRHRAGDHRGLQQHGRPSTPTTRPPIRCASMSRSWRRTRPTVRAPPGGGRGHRGVRGDGCRTAPSSSCCGTPGEFRCSSSAGRRRFRRSSVSPGASIPKTPAPWNPGKRIYLSRAEERGLESAWGLRLHRPRCERPDLH
jgi:hypothetical protein